MASIKKTERTTSESRKISFTVDLNLFIKIENEAKKRNMKISEFIRKVLSDYFNQDKIEKDNPIIELERFTSANSQTHTIEKSEVIDIDSHKLKKISDKFNENLDTSEKEDLEAEFRKLLRERKRKENKYNGGS